MKIIIHEAECNVGYAAPIWRGTDKEALVAEIAKTCRKDWTDPAAGGWETYWKEHRKKPEMGGDPPRVPSTDAEVVSTYFWANPDDLEDERWIRWTTFEVDVDIGAPYNQDVAVRGLTMQRTKGRRTATLLTGDGATLDGTLAGELGDMPYHVEALESLIMALTAEGFPVHTPAFGEAVLAAMEGLADNSDWRDDDEIESDEREVVSNGYQIAINTMFDKWTVNHWEGDHWEAVKGKNLFAKRAEAVTWVMENLIN